MGLPLEQMVDMPLDAITNNLIRWQSSIVMISSRNVSDESSIRNSFVPDSVFDG